MSRGATTIILYSNVAFEEQQQLYSTVMLLFNALYSIIYYTIVIMLSNG